MMSVISVNVLFLMMLFRYNFFLWRKSSDLCLTIMSSLQLDWLAKPHLQLIFKTAFLAHASACACD